MNSTHEAPMTALERGLPIEHLNPVAMAEGNSKKPVYQMHKWWARRLGSVFRTILLGAFLDDSESALWRKFCDGADLEGKVVLDPFVGGGTTAVEALRLGCKVVGIDVNPVAWFITKKEVEPVSLEYLEAAYAELERTAGKTIKRYYSTTCPNGHDAEIMYAFWVKTAECEECSSAIKIFPNYELSHREDSYVCICPMCLAVVHTSSPEADTHCPECGNVFDPLHGNAGRGKFRCLTCSKEETVLQAIKRKGARLDVEMHAIEGYCDTCGRFFKRADEQDLALYRLAVQEFEQNKDSLLFPRQAIPSVGRSDPRPINHGYTHFWQMFNERQLVSLSVLLKGIMGLPDQNVRELMLTAFSDCLDANNMFCKYETRWHKISVLFGLHAYHPIERPAENNVWGTAFGRSTFTKCFEKVRRAKLYCLQPYERLPGLKGTRYSKRTGSERIEGDLVGSFEELTKKDRSVFLRCQSSEDLSFVPSQTVDAIVTDPPYFDNVQYSELADFFYVWLRLGLQATYPWFEPGLSSRQDEVIQNDKAGKNAGGFKAGLTRVFKECHRVLKDEGLLAFTFHHGKTWAWEAMGQAISDAGFYVSATPIVRSEGKSGFHSSPGNIRYDCILVCRKAPSPHRDGDWPKLKARIIDKAVEHTASIMKLGLPVNEVDIYTIIMGSTLEHCTKATQGPDHKGVTVKLAEALMSMESFTARVGDGARPNGNPISADEGKQAEQLTLFLRESKSRFST